jgi:transposase-like protein
MIIHVLHGPNCHGTDIVRHGKTRQGKQQYCCREQRCAGRTFLLDYSYAGQSPEVKQQIVDMAMNASGIRDTARVLHISPNTVLAELKKRHLISCQLSLSEFSAQFQHYVSPHDDQPTPITRVSRATSTTSRVIRAKALISTRRAIWVSSRCNSRKFPPVVRMMAARVSS